MRPSGNLAARNRLARALVWQISGLVAGCSRHGSRCAGSGIPVGFSDALVLESLTQAPERVLHGTSVSGVQEAGLIGVGLVGWPGFDVALALSLAKRMRGVIVRPAVARAWQWIEGRRIFLHPAGAANP